MQTIMSLSYENISFNFPLESDEKNKLWLKFICFIFRLKLLSQKYNYNIFKRHYDLQIIAMNYVVKQKS